MAKQTYQAVQAAIDEAQGRYNKLTSQRTTKAVDIELEADQLKNLKQKLLQVLAEGAKPCPSCKTQPAGMKKDSRTFEVGCLICSPSINDAGVQTSFSARGGSPEEAVQRWNARKFVQRDKNGVLIAE